jgi:hypothetical protein
MPKITKYPKLRVHIRRGKSGQVRCYYVYDMRGTGEPDIPLGRDRDEALRIWDEIRNKRPRIKGTLEEAFQRWEQESLPGYTNAGTARNYKAHLKTLRGFGIGRATWEGVRFPDIKGYLKARKAKTQGNREMALLSIIWNYARGEGLTELPWPAAGMERSRWKNKEQARVFTVSDAIFAAVYSCADQTLRDAMDLATCTGMRLTDCRTVLMPPSTLLRLTASKTSKALDFDSTSSPVLTSLLDRRRAIKASHLMLLSTPDGKPVTSQMLRTRWDNARIAAAKAHPELAEQIEAMYLRDMRKRAADLAPSLEEASKLLQHSSTRITQLTYRTKAEKVKPVR